MSDRPVSGSSEDAPSESDSDVFQNEPSEDDRLTYDKQSEDEDQSIDETSSKEEILAEDKGSLRDGPIWEPLLIVQQNLQQDHDEQELWETITADLLEATEHLTSVYGSGSVSNEDLSKVHFALAVAICSREESRERFLSRLSTPQVNSFRLILRWKAQIQALQPRLTHPRPSHEPSDEQLAGPSLDQHCLLDPILFDTSALDRLCLRELGQLLYSRPRDPGDAASGARYQMLRWDRNDAVRTFTLHRLLRSYVECRIGIAEDDPVRCSLLDLERTIQVESHTSPFLSASIAPCDWLSKNEKKGLPLYLWDIKGRRTVKTSEISARDGVEYGIVSHTWGRWRVSSNADMRPQVPWLVPENRKFDVRELPRGLEILGTNLRLDYVWVDLLCIPQNRSEDAQREIARQAAIFGNAKVAVAWMSHLSSWTATRQSLEWTILLQCAEVVRRQPNHRTSSDLAGHIEGEQQALYEKLLQHQGSNGQIDPSQALTAFWFTSLWTLQESIMRPDMLLANQHWDFLTIGKSEIVSLDDLMLSMILNNNDDGTFPDPLAVWHVRSLFKNCYIRAIVQSDHPLNILSAGTYRFCMESRSEALTAVLGVRDWYIDTIGTDREESLVLGTYHLGLLQELRNKYGHLFFMLKPHIHRYVRLLWGYRKTKCEREPLGSILPFWPQRYSRKLDLKFLAQRLDRIRSVPHPSIQTWTLQSNGGVKMPQAAVIWSSWRTEQGSEVPRVILDESHPLADVRNCHIYALQDEEEANEGVFEAPGMTGYLSEWMDLEFNDTPKYALALSYDGILVHGFVLKELPSDPCQQTSSNTLVGKIADFEIEINIPGSVNMDGEQFRAIESTTVDWVVY